jgi:hypothetical protein
MAQQTWPDGEPRRSPGDAGDVGGVKNGHAVRHSDEKLDNPRPPIGWLPDIPKGDRNGPGVKIGPGTAAWDGPGRSGPFTTGMQRGGKPKGR